MFTNRTKHLFEAVFVGIVYLLLVALLFAYRNQSADRISRAPHNDPMNGGATLPTEPLSSSLKLKADVHSGQAPLRVSFEFHGGFRIGAYGEGSTVTEGWPHIDFGDGTDSGVVPKLVCPGSDCLFGIDHTYNEPGVYSAVLYSVDTLQKGDDGNLGTRRELDIMEISVQKTEYSANDFSWRIQNAPGYEETLPRHTLILDARGYTYRVGEYVGCSDNHDESGFEAGEVTRVSCWFAGAGNDVGVFSDGDTYVVKERWTQESGGPDIGATPRGPWVSLFKVE